MNRKQTRAEKVRQRRELVGDVNEALLKFADAALGLCVDSYKIGEKQRYPKVVDEMIELALTTVQRAKEIAIRHADLQKETKGTKEGMAHTKARRHE